MLFCTLTALELVRLLCQPKVMDTAVRNPAEASALLEALCQQPGVALGVPDHDGWELFHQLLRGGELPTRLCTDAHLAALAIAHGWRLVRLASGGFRLIQAPELLLRSARPHRRAAADPPLRERGCPPRSGSRRDKGCQGRGIQQAGHGGWLQGCFHAGPGAWRMPPS